MDHKLSHIYIYTSPDRAPNTTNLFHSPDVRHLTIGALLCGRQVCTVETVLQPHCDSGPIKLQIALYAGLVV